ncbi:MAG: helix-hairpin-helix domain-containing protein [Acidobacteriota bacterium]|nr:helix-hairpin-helix domain-containing protein [Acidobacteriota bacterium]
MRVALAVLTFGLILTSAAPAQDVVLPDGKAKKIIENNCSDCHGLDQVAQSQMSAADWRTTVNRMVKKGATLSPAEIDMVVDYLSVYFTPDKININAATAQQLIGALQVSAEEADAIVQYRTAHGNFKDLGDLQKVAGVDQKKIVAKKDRISF